MRLMPSTAPALEDRVLRFDDDECLGTAFSKRFCNLSDIGVRGSEGTPGISIGCNSACCFFDLLPFNRTFDVEINLCEFFTSVRGALHGIFIETDWTNF